jgi:hypothetical protein
VSPFWIPARCIIVVNISAAETVVVEKRRFFCISSHGAGRERCGNPEPQNRRLAQKSP